MALVDPVVTDVKRKLIEVVDALNHKLTAAENFAPEGSAGQILTSRGPGRSPAYADPADVAQLTIEDVLAQLPDNVAYTDRANVFTQPNSFRNGIFVDSIAEFTLDAGVAVEGVLLRDGIVVLTETTEPGSVTADTMALYAFNATGDITVVQMKDSTGLVMQLVRDSIRRVHNLSGAAIPKGSVVAISGSTEQVPRIVLADADDPDLGADGLAVEDIDNNSFGRVIMAGELGGLNTNALTQGAPVYLSQTAGEFTATAPAHPAMRQYIGTCVFKNPAQGIIDVDVRTGHGNFFGTRQNEFKIGDGTDGDKLLTFAGLTARSLTMATATGLLTLPGGLTVPGTFAVNDNSQHSITRNTATVGGLSGATTLLLQNLDTTAATLHEHVVRGVFKDTAGTSVAAWRAIFKKEQEWTATAATQDTKLVIDLARDGVQTTVGTLLGSSGLLSWVGAGTFGGLLTANLGLTVTGGPLSYTAPDSNVYATWQRAAGGTLRPSVTLTLDDEISAVPPHAGVIYNFRNLDVGSENQVSATWQINSDPILQLDTSIVAIYKSLMVGNLVSGMLTFIGDGAFTVKGFTNGVGLLINAASSTETVIDDVGSGNLRITNGFGQFIVDTATVDFSSESAVVAKGHLTVTDGVFDFAELHLAGNKVLGARGAAVADATGGTVIDTEARAAINTLLARVRTHGLIAT